MKKTIISLILIGVLLCPMTIFASETENDTDPGADYIDVVEQAIDLLTDTWNDEYWKDENPDKKYLLDIRSTRLIRIKDDLADQEAEYFGDVEYVVEFLLYDDWMAYREINSGQNIGYYGSSGVNNNIVFYKDGHMECTYNFIRYYQTRTYQVDFSTFIEEVIDYHEQFNQVIHFQNHQVVSEEE